MKINILDFNAWKKMNKKVVCQQCKTKKNPPCVACVTKTKNNNPFYIYNKQALRDLRNLYDLKYITEEQYLQEKKRYEY